MTGIFADRTITAIYDSKIREYTVKYVSKGLSLQESTAQYGSYVKYTGDTPVYTAEESAYKYNLFKDGISQDLSMEIKRSMQYMKHANT